MITKFTIQKYDYSKNWDVTALCKDVVDWSTDMNFSAGSLDFSLIEVDEGFTPSNGDMVEFQWDNQKIFKGKIFKVDYDSSEVFHCLAYDQLRYLKSEDTIVFPVTTGQQRFERIMQINQLHYKVVSNQTHKLAPEVFDGNTYFDMISTSLAKVKTATGNEYFLRDNYGTVEFVRATSKSSMGNSNTQTTLLLGDNSNMTSWNFDRNIEELYNVVKVVKENKDNNDRSTYTTKTANSNASVEKFGRLQKVEKAENDANSSQMQNQATQKLAELNVENRTFKCAAIGDLRIKAGNVFWIYIKSLNDIGIGQRQVVATNVTHHFENNWTMDIEGRIV